MVQVLLMYIDQDSDMGGYGHIFQLVAGQLKHDFGVRLSLLHVVQGRYADIAQDHGVHTCILKDMV